MSSVLLTQAVSSGDASAVSALIANGANVNERTGGGQTPLILATIFGHTHLIPLLLQAGADPHLRDNLGLNAIDWAQRRGAAEAIQLFNNYKTPVSGITPVTTPPQTAAQPPSPRETEKMRRASEGEKSQRWLAGLKQRIAEQSQAEVPDGSNIFHVQPEQPPAPEPEPQITPIEKPEPAPRTKLTIPFEAPPAGKAAPPVKAPSPAKPTPPVEEKLTVDATPAVEEAKAASPKTSQQDRQPKHTRKRCPKCGEIYNSDLIAYCAHHVVELVDADAPIISEPPKTTSPVLLWMVVVITLAGSIVVGSLVTAFLYGGKRAPQTAGGPTASPTPPAVQRGTPLVDPVLQNKLISLPIAECPLNGQEAIPGTVVVHIVINKDGRVTSARASGGDWLLRDAATKAATNSTFSPEKLRGRETEGTITYTFEP